MLDASALPNPPRARGAHTFTLLAVLVGFPLTVSLFGGELIGALQAAGGRGWLGFMGAMVGLQWLLFALVRTTQRAGGEHLADLGLLAPTRGDKIFVGTTLVALAGFVLFVGDSSMDRVVNGPWVIPRTMIEKLWMLVVSLTAAICEETLFRGYALIQLRRRGMPMVVAVIVSAISFTMIHGLAQAPVLLAFRAAVGLAFCALVLWRGNLRAAVITHFLVDASLVISV
ncbi:MAG: CPBP family intramembrane metalloprotease [Acidobacteria bacterium]|nr:CPBP family intramembrane metalloprotease [Acidobacteriota bacterium]